MAEAGPEGEAEASEAEGIGWVEAAIRCQRFFGGDPAGWLTIVPVRLVRAYLHMLPRLAAEETLDASTAVGLGTGSLKDARTVTRDLMRLAGGTPATARERPSPAALAEMGIKVEFKSV